MVRLVFAAAACGILLATALSGQTLRTRTVLVEVDVVVTDRQGHPVTGLQVSDFEIYEGLVAETGSYYLLAYASPSPADGRFHRISVKVKRAGLQVRSRSGYRAARTTGETSAHSPLEDLITHAIATPGLPLRLAAVPVPSGDSSRWPVAIALEVVASAIAGADSLEGLLVAVDNDGTIVARDAFGLKLQPPDGADSRWMRIASRLDLSPGRYHVRAALRRGDGRGEGSVFTTLDVPEPEDGIEVGGLTLAILPTGVARAQRLADLLPVVPMAARDLPTAQGRLGALGVRLPAGSTGDVTFKATLKGQHRASVLENTTRPASEFAQGGSGYVFRIPSRGLEPGRYRVVVEVSALVGRSNGRCRSPSDPDSRAAKAERSGRDGSYSRAGPKYHRNRHVIPESPSYGLVPARSRTVRPGCDVRGSAHPPVQC